MLLLSNQPSLEEINAKKQETNLFFEEQKKQIQSCGINLFSPFNKFNIFRQ